MKFLFSIFAFLLFCFTASPCPFIFHHKMEEEKEGAVRTSFGENI